MRSALADTGSGARQPFGALRFRLLFQEREDLTGEEDPNEEQRVRDKARSNQPNGAEPECEDAGPHVREDTHVLETDYLRKLAKRVL